MSFAVVAIVLALVAGQSPEEKAARVRAAELDRREKEQTRKTEEAKRQRELAQRRRLEAFGAGPGTSVLENRMTEALTESARDIDRRHFLAAFEKFQAARLEVLQAVESRSRLKPPAQQIRKTMTGLFDYLNRISKAPSQFDSKELAGFSQAQLQSEFVRVMKEVTPHLDAVFHAEETGEVDLQVLVSVPNVRAGLHKMDWIAKRLR